jgi:hypothetical protein
MRTLYRYALLAMIVLIVTPPGARAALPDAETAESPATPSMANQGARPSVRPPRKRKAAPLHRSAPRRRAPKRPDLDPEAQARSTAAEPDTTSR